LQRPPLNESPTDAGLAAMPIGRAAASSQWRAPPAATAGAVRRNILTVGLYRLGCAGILFATAMLLDLRQLNVAAPYSFAVATALYLLYGFGALWWMRREPYPIPVPLLLTSMLGGDIFFIALMSVSSGGAGSALPILLFPQLAASGWLLYARTAFFHAALATIVLLALDLWGRLGGNIYSTLPFATGLIGFGYFATVAVSVALGTYARASAALAAQRGIDVANLEQVNQLIIQGMHDGVLVVDQSGVVRSFNTQVTRLLGGYGQLRGGVPLAEFSSTLDDYWRRWRDEREDPTAPFRVEATQRLLRVRLVQIGSGFGGGTMIYLEDLGRAQSEAQQMKLAAMGRLAASIAHEVRNPLSAINHAAQLLEEDGAVAPGGERLLSMIRNNAKRIDRIVGEVLQLTRRDRQELEVIALEEAVRSLVDEIANAERIPPDCISFQIPPDLMVVFDRGQLGQIVWNLVRNAWRHCRKTTHSIAIVARAGYMGDAVLFELCDDGPGIPAELRAQVFEPFFTTQPGGTGLGLYVARELADANGATLDLLPKSPGAHFRMTLPRAVERVPELARGSGES
jgi:two-component system sensor histidine kinase PilS (NtrC family)